jgi:hypothetical protein
MILVYHRPYSQRKSALGQSPLRYFIARWELIRPYLTTTEQMKLASNESVLIIGLEPEDDLVAYY